VGPSSDQNRISFAAVLGLIEEDPPPAHPLKALSPDFEFLKAAYGRIILPFVMGRVDPQLERGRFMPREEKKLLSNQ